MTTFRHGLILLAIGPLAFTGCDDNDGGNSDVSLVDMDGAAGGSAPSPSMPGDSADTPTDSPSTPSDDMVQDDGQDPADEPAAPGDIIDVAVAAGSFTQLADALTAAGLVDALKGEGPFTVFAPTDEAFEAFEQDNPGVLESLSIEELTGILTYHVIPGAAVMSGDLQNGQLAETLAGPVVAVELSNGVRINGSTVTSADIEASNGVIHVIDRIIVPPGDIIEVATAAGSFDELAGALTAADLVGTLKGEGPFTVFAPTDAAFAALSAVPEGDALTDVLLYHVLEGIAGPLDLASGKAALTVSGAPVLFDLEEGARINDAIITTTNVVASNGVIHVIDAVIVPPTKDIVEAAIDAGVFTTLAGALTSQGLVETLRGPGPFTVFAPTDDAFAALPAVPEGDALTDVLLYHVVDGAIGSGDLVSGDVEMLSGATVTVDLDNGVKVNESNVTSANILASNGVIHIVDAVLVP